MDAAACVSLLSKSAMTEEKGALMMQRCWRGRKTRARQGSASRSLSMHSFSASNLFIRGFDQPPNAVVRCTYFPPNEYTKKVKQETSVLYNAGCTLDGGFSWWPDNMWLNWTKLWNSGPTIMHVEVLDRTPRRDVILASRHVHVSKEGNHLDVELALSPEARGATEEDSTAAGQTIRLRFEYSMRETMGTMRTFWDDEFDEKNLQIKLQRDYEDGVVVLLGPMNVFKSRLAARLAARTRGTVISLARLLGRLMRVVADAGETSTLTPLDRALRNAFTSHELAVMTMSMNPEGWTHAMKVRLIRAAFAKSSWPRILLDYGQNISELRALEEGPQGRQVLLAFDVTDVRRASIKQATANAAAVTVLSRTGKLHRLVHPSLSSKSVQDASYLTDGHLQRALIHAEETAKKPLMRLGLPYVKIPQPAFAAMTIQLFGRQYIMRKKTVNTFMAPTPTKSRTAAAGRAVLLSVAAARRASPSPRPDYTPRNDQLMSGRALGFLPSAEKLHMLREAKTQKGERSTSARRAMSARVYFANRPPSSPGFQAMMQQRMLMIAAQRAPPLLPGSARSGRRPLHHRDPLPLALWGPHVPKWAFDRRQTSLQQAVGAGLEHLDAEMHELRQQSPDTRRKRIEEGDLRLVMSPPKRPPRPPPPKPSASPRPPPSASRRPPPRPKVLLREKEPCILT